MSPIKLLKEILGVDAKVVKKHKNEDGELITTYGFETKDGKWNLGYLPIKEVVEDYKGHSNWNNIHNTGEMILYIEHGHPKSKKYFKITVPLTCSSLEQRIEYSKKAGSTENLSKLLFTKAIEKLFIKGDIKKWEK